MAAESKEREDALEYFGATIRRERILPLLDFLDVRPVEIAASTPIADAVNIPLEELRIRTHELPPQSSVIQIAGPEDLAEKACESLRGIGRKAELAPRWTYATNACLGRLWEPNRFLADILPKLRVGSALDLACGTGRDSVYMAAHGWNVTGIDCLPDAIEKADPLAFRYELGDRAKFLVDDIEQESFNTRQHDLIFCAFFLHRPLIPKLNNWLKPGGSIVYETFTEEHRERFAKPSSDAHVLKTNELRHLLLEGLTLVHYEEGLHANRYTARAWAMRK